MTKVWVGVDVSKDFLDVALWPSGEEMRVCNEDEQVGGLVADLAKRGVAGVVVEASGGYERRVMEAGLDAGLRVARVPAERPRAFARAQGLRAKTDRIDARLLAEFGAKMDLRTATSRSPVQREIAALVDRRGQLVKQRVRESNRHKQCSNDWVREDIEESLASLDARIRRIERRLDELAAANEELSDRMAILRSCPGVGPAVARTLISELPELGTVTGKQIASLVGVAPFNAESGKRVGKRSIAGGRAKVRAALYMSSLVAAHHDEEISSIYERLLSAGKEKKVALVAIMRKLLVRLNAMVRDAAVWAPPRPASRDA